MPEPRRDILIYVSKPLPRVPDELPATLEKAYHAGFKDALDMIRAEEEVLLGAVAEIFRKPAIEHLVFRSYIEDGNRVTRAAVILHQGAFKSATDDSLELMRKKVEDSLNEYTSPLEYGLEVKVDDAIAVSKAHQKAEMAANHERLKLERVALQCELERKLRDYAQHYGYASGTNVEGAVDAAMTQIVENVKQDSDKIASAIEERDSS